MPISTFPRHDDYDEDEYLLKTRPLRDTRSEGKVMEKTSHGAQSTGQTHFKTSPIAG
jgi:hypothetical protein